MEGSAASIWPELQTIQAAVGAEKFTPKDLELKTGWSRATVHRHLSRLVSTGSVKKAGNGEYVVQG
jgi:DNA-binding IclR family transcriptional regulator